MLILPGLGNNKADYLELAQSLMSLSADCEVEIAPVSRPDW